MKAIQYILLASICKEIQPDAEQKNSHQYWEKEANDHHQSQIELLWELQCPELYAAH